MAPPIITKFSCSNIFLHLETILYILIIQHLQQFTFSLVKSKIQQSPENKSTKSVCHYVKSTHCHNNEREKITLDCCEVGPIWF